MKRLLTGAVLSVGMFFGGQADAGVGHRCDTAGNCLGYVMDSGFSNKLELIVKDGLVSVYTYGGVAFACSTWYTEPHFAVLRQAALTAATVSPVMISGSESTAVITVRKNAAGVCTEIELKVWR